MKTIISVAAFAAATLAVPIFAQEARDGHHATQSSEALEPETSNTDSRFPVLTKDEKAPTKACDCDMMKSGPADGMKKMSGHHMGHPGK